MKVLAQQSRRRGTEETRSSAKIQFRRRGSKAQVRLIGVIIKGGKTRTASKHMSCTWEDELFKLKQEVGTKLN